MDERKDTYLGFELSTKSLKAMVLGPKFVFVAKAEVVFDTDLPEFKTSGGFNTASNNSYFYVRPIMIIKAVDKILAKLQEQDVKFYSVKCISGSAQQHGFVLWTKRGINILQNAIQDKNLSEQLHDGFVMDSLIWSDSRVEQQCEEMEIIAGGATALWKITGTKCYPQFPGPQIRKLYDMRPDIYEKSDKISIFSSFLASLFIGDVAPIEYSDASSMSLFDINEKVWSKVCLQACAPNLEKKLSPLTPPCSIIGRVSKYLHDKYGFASNCKVTSFTGDASSTFTGFLTGSNWIILSLGERDTLMMNIKSIPDTPQLNGQIMCHPTSGDYLGILSFKNGDIARNYVMRTEADNDWNKFNALLDQTAAGNNGNMAIQLDSSEIPVRGKSILKWSHKHTKHDRDGKKGLKRFSSSDIEIRALIEGQMLHRKLLAQNMGFEFDYDTRILLTGVNPDNKPFIKVISDVFSAPVYMMDTEYAALYGDIYRSKFAVHSYYATHPQNVPSRKTVDHELKDLKDFDYYIVNYLENTKLHICNPREDSSSIYAPMLERSRDMLEILQRTSIDVEF